MGSIVDSCLPVGAVTVVLGGRTHAVKFCFAQIDVKPPRLSFDVEE